jgi:hypothetical protein
MKRKTRSSSKASSQVIAFPQPAPTLVPGAAEKIYARAFDSISALLAGRPAGDALKIQLLHHLPNPSYGNRDVLGWTLSGSLVGLLAHWVDGEQARDLHRTREQGMVAWMPLLSQLLEPWDALLLAHTKTTGWQLVYAMPVEGRVSWWEHHDLQKFKAWTNACNIAARIHQQGTMPPLGDPLFPAAARVIIAQLRVLLKQLRIQSLAQQKPANLLHFFEQQAKRKEFTFLRDPHNLRLWLQFVKRNPNIFLTEEKSPSTIFDLFQNSVSGHDPDYIRYQRARG